MARRPPHPLALSLAVAAISAIAISAWGCTDLRSDCQLNLDCPGMAAPKCDGVLDPSDCATCLTGYCCQELADCYSDQECIYGCLEGFYPPDPDCSQAPSLAPFDAILACQKQFCASACARQDECNPVTDSGCPDTTCDAIYPGIYGCTYNTGTPAKLCQACDPVNSPFCDADLHCDTVSGKCARFCCSDADCGTGKCELDQTRALGGPIPLSTIKVGICLTQDGSGPACDAPMTAASGGSCAPPFK